MSKSQTDKLISMLRWRIGDCQRSLARVKYEQSRLRLEGHIRGLRAAIRTIRQQQREVSNVR